MFRTSCTNCKVSFHWTFVVITPANLTHNVIHFNLLVKVCIHFYAKMNFSGRENVAQEISNLQDKNGLAGGWGWRVMTHAHSRGPSLSISFSVQSVLSQLSLISSKSDPHNALLTPVNNFICKGTSKAN